MAPYIDAVVFVLALLFIILSLVSLLENPPDVPGLTESYQTMGGTPSQDLMSLDQ